MTKYENGFKPPICPYCGSESELASTSRVYGGRDYGWLYVCKNYPTCDAYVGTHKRTGEPLGTLANRALRIKRITAHAMVDAMWQGSKTVTRQNVYQWMMHVMRLDEDHCHIAMFDEAQCDRLIERAKAQDGRRSR